MRALKTGIERTNSCNSILLLRSSLCNNYFDCTGEKDGLKRRL
jgi:hypothetical protein